MKIIQTLTLPLLIFNTIAFSVQAGESWWLRTVFNSSSIQPSNQSYINDIDLMDCGEVEGTLLCSVLTQYYDLDVYVELVLGESSIETVRLKLPYSNLSYTKIQAYLRQDGFALSFIRIGKDEFDVLAHLEQAEGEGVSADNVDKQLIEFMNESHHSLEENSQWNVLNTDLPWVGLISDGNNLTVELNRT
jgi:hypothetical protein